MDFGQRGVILTLGEVRSFIRKPYKHSYGYEIIGVNIKMDKSVSKQKKRVLIILTICYLIVLGCYSFIFLQIPSSNRTMLLFMGLTILFAAVAWILQYIEWRISMLKMELDKETNKNP